MAQSRFSRKIIGRVLVYSLAAVLAIAAVVVYKAAVAPSRSPFGVGFFESGRYQYQANHETAYEPKPGFTGVSDLSEPKTYITYDRLGARVDGPGRESTDPVYLMTVGCSQSWGQGVENGQTFTSILGTILEKPVVNFSVSGYGGVGSLLRLRQHINLKPKVIVYAFWEDHFNRNLNRCSATGSPVCLEMPRVQFGPGATPTIKISSHATRNLELTRMWYLEASGLSDKYRTFWTDLYWSGYALWRSVEKEYSQATGHPEEPQDENKVNATNYVLGQMKLTASEVSAQLLVVYIPLYFDDAIRQVPEAVRASAEQQGIQLIDMAERLRGMRAAGVPLAIPGDGHMTAAVHAAIADEVVSRLTHLGL